MPFAARVTDKTAHPGVIQGPGVLNVLIGGLRAAVVGDIHVCDMPVIPPHPPTPFPMGSLRVLIGGRRALRVGDKAGCGAQIITGAINVIIGN